MKDFNCEEDGEDAVYSEAIYENMALYALAISGEMIEDKLPGEEASIV